MNEHIHKIDEPLVSVIINTFNRAKLVSRAINSAIEQTYKNLEVLVIDANSSDNTREVVQAFTDIRVHYNRSDTSDLSTCLNYGFSLAKGKYVALLDDDDEWLPEKIQKQAELFNTLDKTYGWIGCGFSWWDDKSDKIISTHIPYSRGDIHSKLLYGTKVGASGSSLVMIRKSAIDRLGGYISSVRFSTDYLFFLKLSTQYKFDFVPEVLAYGHTNHIYQQSRGSLIKFTKEFIEDKIEVDEYILKEYANSFKAYPKYRYSYYAKLARMYSYMHNVNLSIRYLKSAIETNPLMISENMKLTGSVIYHLYIRKPILAS